MSMVMVGPLQAAPVDIVAHRGASHEAPENTLAAFRLAWRQGADAIEGDFRLTQDGRVVCLHDATTQRTAGVNLAVAEHTFDQLRQLDVGFWKDPTWAGQLIPSLEEVLAIVPPGKKIFIEIKVGPELLPPLAQAIASSNLKADQIIIISFQESVIAQAKIQLPQLKAFWLTGYKRNNSTGEWVPSLESALATLRTIRADGLDTQAQSFIDESWAQALRQANLELHVWTVDDPGVARRFLKLGTRSITTNRPRWLRQHLPVTDQQSSPRADRSPD